MTTTIQYKTLTFSQKVTRKTKRSSQAESIYNPNTFDEDVINLITPSATLDQIEQTIFEEKIIRSFKKTSPLYSSVLFLN